MKKILILLLLLSATVASAQDVIVKKDGGTIVCRVKEVNPTQVVYRKWSALEGPNYVINRTEISVINYENGDKEEFRDDVVPATPATAQREMGQLSDQQLLQMTKPMNYQEKLIKRAKTQKLVGWIGGGILAAGGIAVALAGIDGADEYYYGGWREVYNEDMGWIGGGLILAGAAWTTGFLLAANHTKKKAYAWQVQSAPLFQQEFRLGGGKSLATGIDILKDRQFRHSTVGFGLRYNF